MLIRALFVLIYLSPAIANGDEQANANYMRPGLTPDTFVHLMIEANPDNKELFTNAHVQNFEQGGWKVRWYSLSDGTIVLLTATEYEFQAVALVIASSSARPGSHFQHVVDDSMKMMLPHLDDDERFSISQNLLMSAQNDTSKRHKARFGLTDIVAMTNTSKSMLAYGYMHRLISDQFKALPF